MIVTLHLETRIRSWFVPTALLLAWLPPPIFDWILDRLVGWAVYVVATPAAPAEKTDLEQVLLMVQASANALERQMARSISATRRLNSAQRLSR